MSRPADGGGAGTSSLVVDHATLTKAAAALDQVGLDLDATGSSAPSGGDYGAGAALVTTILSRVTETAARVAFEAKTLSVAVTQANGLTATADREAAETYLVEG